LKRFGIRAAILGIREEVEIDTERNSSKVEMTEKNKYGWG
jgi:hypothetical protein